MAQETFIRVYRYLNSFNADAKFSTWLYRIAYNVFQSWAKKCKRNDHMVESDSNQTEKTENSLSEKVSTRVDLMNALKQIKDIEKMVLILSYEKGLTHREIAELAFNALGKPHKVFSVPVWLMRCLASITKVFNKHQGELLAFLTTAMSVDAVAPTSGTRTLEAHFRELSD